MTFHTFTVFCMMLCLWLGNPSPTSPSWEPASTCSRGWLVLDTLQVQGVLEHVASCPPSALVSCLRLVHGWVMLCRLVYPSASGGTFGLSSYLGRCE